MFYALSLRCRRLLLFALTGSFAITQLLFLHAHHFTDHLTTYGDTHPAEIHGSLSPVNAGHGNTGQADGDDDLDITQIIALKLFTLTGFVVVFTIGARFFLACCRRIASDPPSPLPLAGFVPPLRAPPR